jgi:hypothetical protein
LHCGHVGFHGYTEGLFADAIVGQELALTFRGGAAMATHGRYHKRLRAQISKSLQGRPNNGRNVGNTPAANRHGYPMAPAQPSGQAGLLPLGSNFPGYILNHRLFQILANGRDKREIHRTSSTIS